MIEPEEFPPAQREDGAQRMASAVKAIAELITKRGLICTDFADVASVIDAGGGKAVFAFGEASGENRAVRAAEAAIADLKSQFQGVGNAQDSVE